MLSASQLCAPGCAFRYRAKRRLNAAAGKATGACFGASVGRADGNKPHAGGVYHAVQSSALIPLLLPVFLAATGISATRLWREPDISATHVAFVYGGDIWTATRAGAEVRRLTATPAVECSPRFSPDGRLIAFTRDGDVFVVPSSGGAERRLTWHPQYDEALGWTPDGRSIVIHSDRWKGSLTMSPHLFLLPVEGGWPEPLPVPRATHASFSPDGRRFAYGPVPEAVLFQPWRGYRGGALGYVALYDLAAGTYDELPRGNWNDVDPMWSGEAVYFLSDRDGVMNLYRYALSTRTTARLTSYTEWDIHDASAGGNAIVYENGGWLYVYDLAARTSRRLSITLPDDALPTAADQGRWRQSLEDVWRIYSQNAFRPAGVWSRIKPFYLELIGCAAHWSDAGEVLRRMLAEAGQSHLWLERTEHNSSASRTGLLGADFTVEHGLYRIARIYRGDPANPKQFGPLAGANPAVNEGDFLVAVNGKAVSASEDIYSHFNGLAGVEVKLSIAESFSGPTREVTVTPVSDERALRYYEWVRANAQRVTAATGGRVGYLHVANVEEDGVERFRREWLALRGRVAAVIVDERNNGGGTQPLDILDWIERPPARRMFDHRGEVPPFIGPFIDGPKVMIANEQAASGGDELAYYFQARKMGTLVGTRTMGAMIGNGATYDVTGGWIMGVPELAFFWPELKQWAPENRGVEPDIRVEWRPADLAAHRDPQLEKAIEVASAALTEYRKKMPDIVPWKPGR